jgi:plasmid stability protein
VDVVNQQRCAYNGSIASIEVHQVPKGGMMATLTIRGLDPVTHARLRVEAARHGRSMEAEVRAILQERLTFSAGERGLGSRIRSRFQGLEGDLELPDRSHELPRAAEFDL